MIKRTLCKIDEFYTITPGVTYNYIFDVQLKRPEVTQSIFVNSGGSAVTCINGYYYVRFVDYDRISYSSLQAGSVYDIIYTEEFRAEAPHSVDAIIIFDIRLVTQDDI
jgi:hypothetical protein